MSVLVGYVAVGVFGYLTVPLLLGIKTLPILEFLPTYTLGMACFAISQAMIFYHLSKKEYLFSIVNFILLSAILTNIFFSHTSVGDINAIITLGGIASLLVISTLHVLNEKLFPISSNVRDFLGLFTVSAAQPKTSTQYRILIMNWRDTKHVWAGGAEVYLHELAKRWVALGHRVTFFCGNDGKRARNQLIEGVYVIRRGGFYTVYIWAFLYYIFRFRKRVDVVIDSMNGVPFFTPIYAGVPTLLVLYHVHQKVFREHLSLVPALIAQIVESKLMPMFYRNKQIVTVSESSKVQIIHHRLFSDEGHVEVVNPGVEMKHLNGTKKTSHPSFLYLGRLKAYKNIDVVVAAFAELVQKHPEATLTVAGYGESRQKLEEQAALMGITNQVEFLGRVSESEKIRLMTQSWALVHPSSIEGWGITVIEANSCGTLVIGSNIYGLRDSIIAGKTGFLVRAQNISAFADAMETLIVHPEVRKKLSQEAREWAKEFSWEDSATKFLGLIDKTVTPPTSLTPNRAYA